MKKNIFKKIAGIAGFKLVDKDLFKNERISNNKTYLTVNKLLQNLVPKKIKKIIQIGANDGQRFDILGFFIKKYKIRSFLVEPIQSNFNSLKKNYKNLNFVTLDNSAISVNNEISHLYKVNENFFKNYDKHIPGISSFDIKHLLKHGVRIDHISREKVFSTSIKNLLKKHAIKNFDLLYIDAEGYDGKIAIDFLKTSSIRPLIILEYIHIKNIIFTVLIKNLEKNKYFFFPLKENLVCFPKEKFKFIKF